MVFKDLRDFIGTLEKKKLLKRVSVEVDRDLEITEIADRTIKQKGPALLFENVKGFKTPVLINAFGTEERMALALGVKSLSELTTQVNSLISDLMNAPGQSGGGLLGKLQALPKLMDLASKLFPKTVKTGPCKEVIIKDKASLAPTGSGLDKFPIIKCWPQDGGRYITLPLVFTKNPENGKRNCGMYRMQVFDGATTGMHWQMQKDGARHFADTQRKGRDKIEVAVAIGSDPAVSFAGAVPLPPDVDEMIMAGYLRGAAVEMVKCETVDLEVPANSEIVLEGYVKADEKRMEGPFGDHTGFYSLPEEYPVFHITCITHRKDPIYQTIVVGRPPMEDCLMGLAIERMFLPIMRMHLPEIVDVHMPFEGVFHNLLLVSIRKSYPGHARKVMHALWGMGQAMFSKVIVVVDEDVNIRNSSEVIWKALNNIDPQRDMEFVMGPVDVLDHAARTIGYGSKVGIDATRKLKAEGFTRPWPEEMRIPPEVKAIVDKKWKDLK